ncbi:hypothetical protein D3C72_1188380 [compost metagenome]
MLHEVALGAVGRQEVQLDPAAEGVHGFEGLLAPVDDVVVEDHVNGLGGMALGDGAKPGDEEVGVLPIGLYPDEFPRPHIDGASQVVLLVLPRRQHLGLLSLHHPHRADLGIQVDINLVLAYQDLVRSYVFHHLGQLLKPLNGLLGISRVHAGPRTIPGRAFTVQQPAEVSAMHAGAGLLPHLKTQELAAPRASHPPELLGPRLEKRDHPRHELRTSLARRWRQSLVPQSRNPLGVVQVHRPIHRGASASQETVDFRRRPSFVGPREDHRQSLPLSICRRLGHIKQGEVVVMRHLKYHSKQVLFGLGLSALPKYPKRASFLDFNRGFYPSLPVSNLRNAI